jgi:protein involved in polysaccharide export with SLBB domain
MKRILLFTLFIFTVSKASAQGDSDLILGKTSKFTTAAVYNLSDPLGINIEVNLWGFVRYPGRYIVPVTTTFTDIMSYAGGPTENSNLEEIRILRVKNNSNGKKTELIKLNYENLMWDELKPSGDINNPTLKAGDVILVMEKQRYTFRENLSFYLPILTSILTVATFIVTLTRN